MVVGASALLVPEFVESTAKDAFLVGGICVACNVFVAVLNEVAGDDVATMGDAALE